MRSNSTNVRCIGVQCPPPHESHDKRLRALHREYDERIRKLPKTPDTRLRRNWSFALAPNCAGKCRRCGVDSVVTKPQTHLVSGGDTKNESPGEIWRNMSQLLSLARRAGRPTLLNDELVKAAEAVKGTALEFVFRLWIGDNHRVENEWDEAIQTYRGIVKEAGGSSFLGHPIMPRVLEYLADCHTHIGEVDNAADALEVLARTPDPDTSLAWVWYKIGSLLESDKQFDRAKRAYIVAAGAAEPRSIPSSNWRDLAARAVTRMDGAKSAYFVDGHELVRKLKKALKSRDESALRWLASTTHFHVGGGACDGWMTEGGDYLAALLADLAVSLDVTLLDDDFDFATGRLRIPL